MSNTSETVESTVKRNKPKTLTGLRQKAKQSVASCFAWGTRTFRTAGEETGTNSFMLLERNTVNPTFRPGFGAGASARNADGMAGRGCWKKRRPFCNGADRSCDITPPRKRADFQRVVRDETTGRTFAGGNRK